jgi:Mn2+/Fe2+ NRAMP family transporter
VADRQVMGYSRPSSRQRHPCWCLGSGHLWGERVLERPNEWADEQRMLEQADQLPLPRRLGTYMRLSGPGWLQSALTLGGGSLAGSLYLGVVSGVTFMWLQPIAMILGIVMLSAISYVTLSTGERPFRQILKEVSPLLGWLWLVASLMANMVWALPQYSLCHGVLSQNLFPTLLGAGAPFGGDTGKWIVSGVVLALSTFIVWSYGSGGWGIKLYELTLKLVVALIVLCFIGVVIQLGRYGALPWNDIFAGLIPDLTRWNRPADGFLPMLTSLPEQVQAYWSRHIVLEQRKVMLTAVATAVGINMTFLLPYSMLAKGWNRSYRGLAIFDLSTGMLIPFMLATGCVIIASAKQFHATPVEGVVQWDVDGQVSQQLLADPGFDPITPETSAAGAKRGYVKLLAARLRSPQLQAQPVQPAEQQLAASLIRRDAGDLSKSIEPLVGPTFANIIFGLGVVAMTLSTVSMLMLVSGFVVCEVLDVPPRGWIHRIGCLAAATGALWPVVWTGDAQFWLAVVTSLFGMALLPIAYITFFLMMNSRRLLGDDLPRAGRRWLWNSLMGLACVAALFGSLYVVWSDSQEKLGSPWWGMAGLGLLAVLIFITRRR